MRYLMGAHRVADFELWLRTLREHAPMHAENGLRVLKVWRSEDDPARIYFLYEVLDPRKARAMVARIEAQRHAPGADPANFPELHFVSETPV